jgi:hypothetical protein
MTESGEMNKPTIDAEQLAALLDGRLTDAERRALVERLAESPSDLTAFADAASVIGELGLAPTDATSEPAAKPGDTPGPIQAVRLEPVTPQAAISAPYSAAASRPRSHRRWYANAAAAAAIAAIAILPWWVARARRLPDNMADVVALVDRLAPGLPVDWDGEPWEVTRGASADLTAAPYTARIGARLTDLEVAANAGDTTALGIAEDIARLLDAIPASGPALTIYDGIHAAADHRPEALTPLVKQGRRALTGLVDADWLEAGAWAEAARLAAARHDASFFASGTTRRIIEHASADTSRPAVAAAMVGVGRLLPVDSRTDWRALEAAATTALREMTRR